MTGTYDTEPAASNPEHASLFATVGMFERPGWGGGFFANFAPGEIVRVRDPIPSIVIQSLGQPLPSFASATPFVAHEPDWEIDLIYEAPWLDVTPMRSPPRLGHVRPRQRLVVCDRSLTVGLSKTGALPTADLVVAAKASDLAALAEALAILITGNVLVGLDFAGVLARIGATGGSVMQARGYVRLGFDAPEASAELRGWIEQVAGEGCAGDLLLLEPV